MTAWCVSDDCAEIAVDEVLQVDQVPDRQRPVEPVVLLEGLDRRGIGGRLLAEVRRRRVARDELGEHERDERDPEHEQQERADPAQDEAQQARRGPQPAAARGGSRLRYRRDRHRNDASRRRLGSATMPSGSTRRAAAGRDRARLLEPDGRLGRHDRRVREGARGPGRLEHGQGPARRPLPGAALGLPLLRADDRGLRRPAGDDRGRAGLLHRARPPDLVPDRLRGARVHADGRARADAGGGPPERTPPASRSA